MRIGLFHSKPYYVRYYQTALAELLARGHELVLARPESAADRPTARFLRDRPGVSERRYPDVRADGLQSTTAIVRATRDLVRLDRPGLQSSSYNRQRAVNKLRWLLLSDARALPREDRPRFDPPEQTFDEAELGVLEQTFDDLERLIPPDNALVDFIRAERLDVVLLLTRVKAAQFDVIKAARGADVPSGVIVYSWDNLTSYDLVHVQPDALFVWNEIGAREAEVLHGVDPSRIVATGAPRFDRFFSRTPSAPRQDILAGLGLDPARKTVLYVGSSTIVAPREHEFVDEWLRALRGSPDERVATANVIVRPHPGSLKPGSPWLDWRPAGERAVLALPVHDKRQSLYDELFVSDAVVGLNTSAEIEAAIVSRPVLTVRAGDRAPGQEATMHFEHLLDETGGCVMSADDLAEHVGQLAEAIDHDPQAESRTRFLEMFVRPHGLDRPAGPVLADAIEALAPVASGRLAPSAAS